jgi:hypothetical protein
MKIAIALVLLSAACGNKSSQPSKPVTEQHAGDEHGAMMPEIAKFHDVLAPRWHADKGDKRMADTCAATAQLHASADAIAKAATPAGADAAKWSAGTKELTDAVVALEASCTAKDAAAFEPAFTRVHTNFHALMESSGGEHHEMHDEHEHEHM